MCFHADRTEGAGYSALQVLSCHWLTSWLQLCTKTMFELPGLLAIHHCSPSMFWSQRASKCQAHAPFHSGSAEEERGRGDERVAQTFWSHSCRIGSKEMLLQLHGTHLAWNEVWHWAGCGNLGWEWCRCVGSWSLIVRFPKTVPRLKQFCHEVSKVIWRKSWPPFGSSYCFSFSSPFILASLEVC